MKKNYNLIRTAFIAFILMFFTKQESLAQVGIGTTSPSTKSSLDITSTSSGVLIPRMTTAQRIAIAPALSDDGLKVYDTTTKTFWYWDGTKWVEQGSSSFWSTTGNATTVAGTNFIGTTDAVDFRIKTNATDRWNISNANSGQLQSYSLGTAAIPTYSWQGDQNTGFFSPVADNLAFTTNGTERARIIANGAVGIGTTTPRGALEVATTANNYGFVPPVVALTASNAQAPVTNPQGGAITAGTVVYNTATAGAAPNNVGPGLYYWDGAKWIAFAGSPGGLDWTLTGNASTTPATNFVGTTDAQDLSFRTNNTEKMRIFSNGSVQINAAGSAAEKLWVAHTGAGNDAIKAVNNDDVTGKGNAIWATNANALGVALIASSGATPPSVLPATLGAGISGSHVDGYGIYGYTGNGAPNNAAHNGHAAGSFSLDTDNNVSTNGTSAFARLAGKDNADPDGAGGVGAAQLLYGGYFEGGVASAGTTSFAYTGIKYNHNAAGGAGTNYKIIGNGAVSTLIPDENNKPRIMFAPEAPEVLFEDFGVAKLINGETYVKIDKILAKSLKIDDKHPLKVFIQLEGDCNGVFVTEKSIDGFKVKELANGNSNVSFSWHIVANRADSKDDNGNISSEFENLRLPIGPKKLKEDKLTSKESSK